ncbi:putative outer membrane protein [Tahibacter aquaticus]|uniref:Putative outer membrane protein n=1 Tax=Tahibacter aquaticus TaxID=520092 RepID=A0A4R6Z0F0_9GAMM|nr:DUF4142 domain-containing protein [Tahibacter aquaticus]TDR44987.1 putative outer membrane protein [Tahibacter aquaticus]
MRTTRIAATVVLTLAVCSAASAQNPAKTLDPPTTPAGAPQPSPGDSEALSTLSAVNEHEIASAEIAQGKALGNATREYARMLQKDHNANLAKVKELSQTTRTPLAESAAVKAMKDSSAAEREQLGRLDGKAFESAYLQAMIDGHAKVLSTIDQKLLPAATDAAIATHLRNTRESVNRHLSQARKLKSELPSGA